jgi:PAS domain S-box-containing protein
METSIPRRAVADADPAAEHERLRPLVFAEQVALLHARSPVAQAAVFVNASIVTAVFWGLAPRLQSLLWLAVVCAVALARTLANRAYGGRPRAPEEARTWARVFVVGAALNGLAWGATAFVFQAPSSPAHEMFIAFVLGGMAAGAASSNASHAPAFIAFTAPALLPMIVHFAAERDLVHVAMALMLALFGVAVAVISRTGGRAVEDAIRLRLRNESLVAGLTAAQERLESLNAMLERRVANRTAELERSLALRLDSEARLLRFRLLLDHIGEAILVAGARDLRVIEANDGACDLLQASPEALLGRRLDELGISPSLDGAAGRALVESLRPGEVRTFEDRRVHSDGPPRALELSMAVREIERQLYVLVVARDVSARKEMENRLAQSGLLASLGSLAAGVAHEINNPLAYVLANLQHLAADLESSALPPREKASLLEVVQESLEGARRARAIMRDLSSLSPREQAAPEPVDVRAVLQSCVNVATSEIRHRATLVRELADVPPVSGDRTRLAQVFLNLLVNAAHAIPEGDAAKHRITLRTRFDAAGGMVLVDVADTGCGIPAADMSRIFQPFFTTKPVGRGTGLGLSICRGIATALGGDISVASRPGEGSTFTVSLRPALSGLDPPRARPSPAAMLESERSARLLVIDDDPGVARALRRALLQRDVTVAIGGLAGIAALEKERFDVVLCDVMMPDVTGMDVHRRLRELRPGAERTIVFVTGGTFSEEARAFLQAIPNARLSKPFEFEDVRAAVRSALALDRT